MRILLLCLPLWLVVTHLPARAQTTDRLSPEARVSLLTILPGNAVYSQFGHSALRVHDPVYGIERVYNYGTFDFDDPLFVPRFVRGQLDYYLSVADFFEPLIAHYARREHRSSIEQVLNLSEDQKEALYAFLEWNALPENRVYRYDFFRDNCSTRIRDALQQALGSALQFSRTPDPQESFRDLIRPYGAHLPFVDLGMHLGLGSPADEVANWREVMFLPDYLMLAVGHASVVIDGNLHPLVARTDTLVWVGRPEESLPWPTILFWLLLLLGALRTISAYRHRLRITQAIRLQDGVLLGFAGVAGLLLLFLWLGTEHQVTERNWNLLWAWPTHLLAAVYLVRRPTLPHLRGYLLVAGAVTLLTAAGWPLWPQELPLPILPLLLLLGLRMLWLAHALSPRTATAV